MQMKAQFAIQNEQHTLDSIQHDFSVTERRNADHYQLLVRQSSKHGQIDFVLQEKN